MGKTPVRDARQLIRKQKAIANARYWFGVWGTDTITPETARIYDEKTKYLEMCLKEADVGYEILDRTGTKTVAEIEAEVKARIIKRNIVEARHFFARLESGATTDGHLLAVDSKLKAAGVGYEALDPTGTKTAGEMEAEIISKVTKGYFREARSWFNDLNREKAHGTFSFSTSSIPSTLNLLDGYLKKAGVGYEALDPTGSKTADQMKAEVKATAARGLIGEARHWFASLSHSDYFLADRNRQHFLDTCLDLIDKNLKAAGAGYEALDPDGTKTADQMKAEVVAREAAGRMPRPTGQYGKLALAEVRR